MRAQRRVTPTVSSGVFSEVSAVDIRHLYAEIFFEILKLRHLHAQRHLLLYLDVRSECTCTVHGYGPSRQSNWAAVLGAVYKYWSGRDLLTEVRPTLIQ